MLREKKGKVVVWWGKTTGEGTGKANPGEERTTCPAHMCCESELVEGCPAHGLRNHGAGAAKSLREITVRQAMQGRVAKRLAGIHKPGDAGVL